MKENNYLPAVIELDEGLNVTATNFRDYAKLMQYPDPIWIEMSDELNEAATKIIQDKFVTAREMLNMLTPKRKVTNGEHSAEYIDYAFDENGREGLVFPSLADATKIYAAYISERDREGDSEPQTRLYRKVLAEQQQYRAWLLSQPPEEILNHCYEFTVREDIVMALETAELSDKQCEALLQSRGGLADIYKDFSKRETDHMENILDTIECRANAIIRENRVRQQSAPEGKEQDESRTYCAEWIDYMNAYRLYDPKYPSWTVAYIDNLNEAKQRGDNIVVIPEHKPSQSAGRPKKKDRDDRER